MFSLCQDTPGESVCVNSGPFHTCSIFIVGMYVPLFLRMLVLAHYSEVSLDKKSLHATSAGPSKDV